MTDHKKTRCQRQILLPLIVAFLIPGLGYSQGIEFADTSLKQAKILAKQYQKPVFIDFYAEWCKPCKIMEEEVFDDGEVGSFINQNFIAIRVDGEEEQNLTQQYGIQVYPSLMFLDTDGKLLVKYDGALGSSEFLRLSQDMLHLRTYQRVYKKKDSDPAAVYNYARSVNWINPSAAGRVARKYLSNTPVKKWNKEENWSLIREFVPGTEQTLFRKAIASEDLRRQYPEAFKAYVLDGLNDILNKSLKLRNSIYLKHYAKYVNAFSGYFPNADSTILGAKMTYASEHDPLTLPALIEEYLSKYEKENPEALARYAEYLAENYFRKELLEHSVKWSTASLELQKNVTAYIARALAYEKMNEFRMAYANIIMAESIAPREDLELIVRHEKRIFGKMAPEHSVGVNAAKYSTSTEDGRFTLGAGNKRLMYGYPVPTSTSHFVINIDGKLATNSPALAKRGLEYLTGRLDYGGKGITPEVRVSFSFKEVRITQILTPVDKSFKELEEGLAQYYKVSYQFGNPTGNPRKIGLGVLFDTMIDDNDHCVIAADGRVLQTELAFAGPYIPNELLFYKTPGDTSDMMGTAILMGHGATKPDKLVVGRWPVLHQVTWKLSPQKVGYGDSAYFLKWENRTLYPKRELEFITYYGLPAHKRPELQILVEDPNYLTLKEDVYFEHGRATLDLNAKMKISQLIEKEDIMILGVLLNGYTDVIGKKDYNFDLSRSRIENVGRIFTAYKIPYVPKPYGLERSDHSAFNEKYGNVWDRRVEIVIYYKPKRDPDPGMSASLPVENP